MPLIPIAMALAQLAGQFAPTVIGWLGGDKAEDVAQKVVDVATSVTGKTDLNETVAMLQSDPDKAMQFQERLMDRKVELAKIANEVPLAEIAADVATITQVNASMQSEAKSEHWAQWGWRPYIGFVFGTYIASLFILPIFHVTPIRLSVDETMAVLTVLGVASWGRSIAKRGVNS